MASLAIVIERAETNWLHSKLLNKERNIAMKHYIGLDISMESISFCILSEEKEVEAGTVPANVQDLDKILSSYKARSLIGLETGSTSNYFYHQLRNKGYEVVCLEAHHTRKALSSNPVKNDANDSKGIAQLLRPGWYKSVHVKEEKTQLLKSLITARETIKHKITDLKNTIREIVKPFGLSRLSSGGGKSWVVKVKEQLLEEDDLLHDIVNPLLLASQNLCDILLMYDQKLSEYAQHDEVCRNLMTIPGVDIVNAVAFKATIEIPSRIKKTRSIGHYLGLTPKICSSGEVERRGRITKCGPAVMRSLLFEAAQCLLRRVKTLSTLKCWGFAYVSLKK